MLRTGQRLVHKAEDLAKNLDSCVKEAEMAFGDGTCFIEEFVSPGRHIEVQVLGDGPRGNAVHMYERDCSVQLRNQKVSPQVHAFLSRAQCTAQSSQKRTTLGAHNLATHHSARHVAQLTPSLTSANHTAEHQTPHSTFHTSTTTRSAHEPTQLKYSHLTPRIAGC